MSLVHVSRPLAFPVEQVWEKLSDFGGIHRYSAGVQASPINPGTPERGLGAERNCQLYDGNHIQERVTEAVQNRSLALEVFDTSMPLKSATARFDLSPAGDGCVLEMTMEYQVKYGPVGWLMDAMMLNRAMTGSLSNLLAGLEAHLRTGDDIPKGWRPASA
jgi:hypothetical protein